jgi:hypothetical protein
MARYSFLLGTGIEVFYRFHGIALCACGKLLRDSGTFIIVEQRLARNGSSPVHQLKLPYDCIIKVREVNADKPTFGSLENTWFK